MKTKLIPLSTGSSNPFDKGGTSFFLYSTRGHGLIDAGANAAQNLVKFVTQNEPKTIDEIQAIFITHFDQDHFKDFPEVVEFLKRNRSCGNRSKVTVYIPKGGLREAKRKISHLHCDFLVFREVGPGETIECIPLGLAVSTHPMLHTRLRKASLWKKLFSRGRDALSYCFSDLRTGEKLFTFFTDGIFPTLEDVRGAAAFAKGSPVLVSSAMHTSTVALQEGSTHAASCQHADIANIIGAKSLYLYHTDQTVANDDRLIRQAQAHFDNSFLCQNGQNIEI